MFNLRVQTFEADALLAAGRLSPALQKELCGEGGALLPGCVGMGVYENTSLRGIAAGRLLTDGACELLEPDYRRTLRPDELSAEDLQKLTDYLAAGMGDPPNEKECSDMHRQGFTALQEIYTRILDRINDKYGESIRKLSSYDYIRRLPDIEEDFSCLENMQLFFTRYCPRQRRGGQRAASRPSAAHGRPRCPEDASGGDRQVRVFAYQILACKVGESGRAGVTAQGGRADTAQSGAASRGRI